ncbi:MAG: response regulator, partial [Candidatus Hodarchaeota archaeon]
MKSQILVIEDDANILFNIKLILEFNEYKPLTATNGLEALELLSNLDVPPDLILSDIMMPKMDGYEFYNKISADSTLRLIPFVFISAKSSPEHLRFAKTLGFRNYIKKPFNKEDLLEVIGDKLIQGEKNKRLSKDINDQLEVFLQQDEFQSIFFFLMRCTEKENPILELQYPEAIPSSLPLSTLSIQFLQSFLSIFKPKPPHKMERALFRIKRLAMDVFILFYPINDGQEKNEHQCFVFTTLAPKITYL